MDVNTIRSLAEVMSAYGLTSLSWQEAGAELKLERQSAAAAAPVPNPVPAFTPAPVPAPSPVEEVLDLSRAREVTAPMVGVFYSASAPGAAPFVKVGDRVKKGDVLCILEAMKLMNEITAEEDGEVVDICAGDGELVEYGQTLFKLFPTGGNSHEA